jgi:dUTP pyrophosphatase
MEEEETNDLRQIRDALLNSATIRIGQRGLVISLLSTGADSAGQFALRALVAKRFGVEPSIEAERLTIEGLGALDLLGYFVDSPLWGDSFSNTEARRLYYQYAQHPPRSSNEEPCLMRVERIEETAVAPQKTRPSDSGYDLTLIAVRKRFGLVTLYGTGLIVEPPEGYYFDVIARSSIIKTGHMLANNVGVIDRAYRGELMVPLIKLDPAAPEIVLPARLAQLIPRPIVHFPVEVVASLTATTRGAGGFGSTG